jgi:hypothetical protein
MKSYNLLQYIFCYAQNIFVGKPEGKKYSEDPGVDGRVILEGILGK